jgi:hypothetical protein
MATVADALRIARSHLMLTTGMRRGDSYRIATLSLKSSPYPLSEFCVLLSMFCIFSPEYKLMGEQCYWFADVVLRAVRKRSPSSEFIKEKDFHMAGKYGSVVVPQSSVTRAKIVGTFEVIAAFSGIGGAEGPHMDWWHSKGDTIDLLLLLVAPDQQDDRGTLFSVTEDVRRRAIGALALITTGSRANQLAACNAGALSSNLWTIEMPYLRRHSYGLILLSNLGLCLDSWAPLLDDAISTLSKLIGATDDILRDIDNEWVFEVQKATEKALVAFASHFAEARHSIVGLISQLVPLLTSGSVDTRSCVASLLAAALLLAPRTCAQIEGRLIRSVFIMLSDISDDLRSKIMTNLETNPEMSVPLSVDAPRSKVIQIVPALITNSTNAVGIAIFRAVRSAASSPSIAVRLAQSPSVLSFLCFQAGAPEDISQLGDKWSECGWHGDSLPGDVVLLALEVLGTLASSSRDASEALSNGGMLPILIFHLSSDGGYEIPAGFALHTIAHSGSVGKAAVENEAIQLVSRIPIRFSQSDSWAGRLENMVNCLPDIVPALLQADTICEIRFLGGHREYGKTLPRCGPKGNPSLRGEWNSSLYLPDHPCRLYA